MTLGECGPGEPISPEDGAYGLLRLNAMLNSWSTRRLFIYTINIDSYQLLATIGTYAIGAGSPQFNAARPLRIDTARILMQAGANYVGVKDLDIITQPEFVELSDKNALASIPEKLYNDGSWPLSNLSLYPAPTCVLPTKLELGTWTALTEFATLQSVFSFPPGYYAAIVDNLVIELGPAYNKPADTANASKALEYMGAIQALNRANGIPDADFSRPVAGQETTPSTNG